MEKVSPKCYRLQHFLSVELIPVSRFLTLDNHGSRGGTFDLDVEESKKVSINDSELAKLKIPGRCAVYAGSGIGGSVPTAA